MKFEEVLPALKAGKKIRRISWPYDLFYLLRDKKVHVQFRQYSESTTGFYGDDILADDWEIVDD